MGTAFNSGLMPVRRTPASWNGAPKDWDCAALSAPDYQSPYQIGHTEQRPSIQGVHYLGSFGVGARIGQGALSRSHQFFTMTVLLILRFSSPSLRNVVIQPGHVVTSS